MTDQSQDALRKAMEEATQRLIAAGKDATPEMADEAKSLLMKWLESGNAESAKRWAEIANKVTPPAGGNSSYAKAVLPKGMSVGSAILGTVAIGGGIYLASKLFSSPKPQQPTWADRVVAARANPQAQSVR